MSSALVGKVVALIGAGSEADRAVAVACAEAGADIALATQVKTQPAEFAMASIANEIWVIGREQFLCVMDACEAPDVMSFAEEAWDRLGRCDVLIAAHDLETDAPIDELSPDEWRLAIERNLTAPYLAVHAFGRLMERAHGGTIILVAGAHGGDAAYAAAKAGLVAMAERLNEGWSGSGVRVRVVLRQDPQLLARAVVHALQEPS